MFPVCKGWGLEVELEEMRFSQQHDPNVWPKLAWLTTNTVRLLECIAITTRMGGISRSCCSVRLIFVVAWPKFKHWCQPALLLSFSGATARALTSCSALWSFSSLRRDAFSWPSTSAALLRLVMARLILSAASLIFSSFWISCRRSTRASSRRCWNTGSRMLPSSKSCNGDQGQMSWPGTSWSL